MGRFGEPMCTVCNQDDVTHTRRHTGQGHVLKFFGRRRCCCGYKRRIRLEKCFPFPLAEVQVSLPVIAEAKMG